MQLEWRERFGALGKERYIAAMVKHDGIMKQPAEPAAAEECYRCGYDLRGIANDRACPECGLLAERSRRITDELHHTRPAWLAGLSHGVWFILAGIAGVFVWTAVLASLGNRYSAEYVNAVTQRRRPPVAAAFVIEHIPALLLGGFGLCALGFALGCWRLARAEGYPPADQADRRRRVALRALSLVPLAGMACEAPLWLAYPRALQTTTAWLPLLIGLVICIPLPLLLFHQLRSIAGRARSAALVEHCAIVGIGTSVTLAYLSLVLGLSLLQDATGVAVVESDSAWLMMTAIAFLGVLLFLFWGAAMLIRFGIHFRRARQHLRAQWKQQDQAEAVAS
jgi:hypothetical protein